MLSVTLRIELVCGILYMQYFASDNTKPLFIGGDFNVILSDQEKYGGRTARIFSRV